MFWNEIDKKIVKRVEGRGTRRTVGRVEVVDKGKEMKVVGWEQKRGSIKTGQLGTGFLGPGFR